MEVPDQPLSRAEYAALATFRHELRRFLAFSAAEAAKAGLPVQQHQAMLAIAGRAASAPMTVGGLAEQLIIAPHTATELVRRMERAGYVTRTTPASDQRRSELALTERGQEILAGLSRAHLRELLNFGPALARILGRLTSERSS